MFGFTLVGFAFGDYCWCLGSLYGFGIGLFDFVCFWIGVRLDVVVMAFG